MASCKNSHVSRIHMPAAVPPPSSPTGRISMQQQQLLLVQIALFISTLLLLPSNTTALILNYTTRGCSKHCESKNCNNAQTIRYGKFCGVGYTGCPNQSPCDRLDACCRHHDVCVGSNPVNFPNQTCRSNLRECLQQYLSTGAAVYHGSNCSAMTVQNTVMVALKSTTFPHDHQQLAPSAAPQAGAAASALYYSHSPRLLHPCIFPIALFLSCFSFSLLPQPPSAMLAPLLSGSPGMS